MNTQLIPVASRPVGSETIPTINARELHAFLGVGKDFSTWMKDRVESFGFTENQDFVVFPEIGEKGGRPSKEYALTLDMAKELSMVERNAKGKQARQYFIDCERQAKQAHLDPMQALNDPATLRNLCIT
jgi:anti-repressor protein